VRNSRLTRGVTERIYVSDVTVSKARKEVEMDSEGRTKSAAVPAPIPQRERLGVHVRSIYGDGPIIPTQRKIKSNETVRKNTLGRRDKTKHDVRDEKLHTGT
jgi:hypothetical protein